MFKNNKEFQLNYLTCLQNTFIENMKENECAELLREINSLDTPSLQMSRNDYMYGINIQKIIVEKGIKEVPYITKAEDYIDSRDREYNSSILTNLYYVKINFFAKKGNNDANDILNKLVKEFPYEVISEKIVLNLNLSKIEDKTKPSEIFVKHKKLYELFLNYENVGTPLSYDKLADYWNDNIDHWNKYLHKERNTYIRRLSFGAKEDNVEYLKSLEDSCIQSIQKYIGEAVFLDFMVSPSKHLEFTKRMPELLDLFDWFKDSFPDRLCPFLEQEHIDVMAKMGADEEKKLFIDSIFDIKKFVSDAETGEFLIREGPLNRILNLVDKGINFNPMFGSKYDNLAPNVSLAEFYSNKKNERTEKIKKSLAENIELMEQRIGAYILNNSLQKGLQVNEQKQKSRVKI
jgi:hypothetical protein